MKYSKGPLTIDQQIALLESRGLRINNIEIARRHLTNINYYRLSAYLLSFQKYGDPSHTYMPWATFEKVVELYVFDRELRLICIDAVERIEVALRSRIAYEFSTRYGNNWYEDPDFYVQMFEKTKKTINDELSRTRELSVKHYKAKYTVPKNPPAWVTVEILSFGQLSVLYKNLRTNDAKKAVAEHFGVSYQILESWMEHLAYIRNICAHHGRLWNRTMTVTAQSPKHPKHRWITVSPTNPDKLYASLCIMNYLIDCSNTYSPFTGKLKSLIHRFPQVNLKAAGFPQAWHKDPFWRLQHITAPHKFRIMYFKCRHFLVKAMTIT